MRAHYSISTLNSSAKVKQAIKIVALTRLKNSNDHILRIRKKYEYFGLNLIYKKLELY